LAYSENGRFNDSRLTEQPIEWLKRAGEPEWYAFVGTDTCELVLGDFPAEPLYTVKWRGEVLTLDDAPRAWSIPYHE
jgi:hypothetical protein